MMRMNFGQFYLIFMGLGSVLFCLINGLIDVPLTIVNVLLTFLPFFLGVVGFCLNVKKKGTVL